MRPQWTRIALQIKGLEIGLPALGPRYAAMPLTVC